MTISGVPQGSGVWSDQWCVTMFFIVRMALMNGNAVSESQISMSIVYYY